MFWLIILLMMIQKRHFFVRIRLCEMWKAILSTKTLYVLPKAGGNDLLRPSVQIEKAKKEK